MLGRRRSDARPNALPRSHRLTRGSELQLVGREGKRTRTGHLEVRSSASLFAHPRVGFIVPKHKHGSVERNTLKRRLRELARAGGLLRALEALPVPVDVVIRARPEAYSAPFAELEAELARAAERLARIHGAAPAAPSHAAAPAAPASSHGTPPAEPGDTST